MKKMIATLSLVAALAVVPAAHAEEVTCSTNGQYAGAVCGVNVTTTTTVEHKTVQAGIGDSQFARILAIAGVSALAATLLYKASYRWYILG